MATDRNRRRDTEKRDKKEDKMNEHGDIRRYKDRWEKRKETNVETNNKVG